MFYQESPDKGGIDEIILTALRQILAHQNAERFLDWGRETIPDALKLDAEDLAPGENLRLAVLLSTAIWNATPLPVNGFRAQPLAKPQPNAPCPCGSGLSYLDCCARVEGASELPADLMWELMIGELNERELQRALASGEVPLHLMPLAAERWLAEDRPGRAVALLEPLFAEQAGIALDERFEHALNVLCDTYDRLDHWKKKRAFLERMTAHDCRQLRSSAWQRLCTIHIDEDDFTTAQLAFSQAQREGPDNPGTALLEITLLAAQHEDDLARNRAVFWLHKLRRATLADEDMLAFLAHAARDPQDALMTSQSAIIDPRLMILREWVRAAIERPLPAYGLKPCRSESAQDPVGQFSLFGELDAAGTQVPTPEPRYMARLCAPMATRRLESRWRGVFASAKPASTRLVPMPSGDLWEGEDWVAFLAGRPETADSLDILDDLATALYAHPESALPWIARSLLVPVLERAGHIVERILPEPTNRTIPWAAAENRPALRLLFRLHLAQTDEGRESAAVATLRTLLRLNPSDNHGVRAELMNHYLRRHENDEALDLAERFPDDRLADLAYGEVLALYRMGARTQARHALHRALARLPRILAYLTRKRVPRPRLDEVGIASDADDEAWLYREAMLDVWEAEPGLLDWLRRQGR